MRMTESFTVGVKGLKVSIVGVLCHHSSVSLLTISLEGEQFTISSFVRNVTL